MVQDPKACLHALHHALVAARNAGLAGDAQALLNIVDSTEMIPLWIADETIDRTKDMLQTFELLAVHYPQCRLASNVAQGKPQ